MVLAIATATIHPYLSKVLLSSPVARLACVKDLIFHTNPKNIINAEVINMHTSYMKQPAIRV